MRAVNLLPPDLRSGPKGSAPPISAGSRQLRRRCVRRPRRARRVRVRARPATSWPATPSSSARPSWPRRPPSGGRSRSRPRSSSRTPTSSAIANARVADRQGSRRLALRLGAGAARSLARRPGGRHDRLLQGRPRHGTAAPAAAPSGGIRGAITAPAITLAGCTTGQTEVATLMARLRTIDGVTRVSLSKSDKEADRGGGTGGDRTAPNATGYCGKASVPAFELVMFFEGAAAASTAPAPGAAATATASTTAGDAAPPAAAAPARDAGRTARPGARRRRSRGDAGCRHHHVPPRRLPRADTVTKNKTLLIAVVATAAAVAAFWILALAPKREEATALEGKIADQADRSSQARAADARELPGSQGRLRQELRHGGPARQGRAGRRRRPLAARAAGRRGRRHRRRLPHDPGRRRRRAVRRAPRPPARRPRRRPRARSAVGTAGFSAMPFTFSFTGTLRQPLAVLLPHGALRDPAQREDERHRPPAARWSRIDLQVDQAGFPNIRAQIGASSYLVPETQGLTAGATPAGPAATQRRPRLRPAAPPSRPPPRP